MTTIKYLCATLCLAGIIDTNKAYASTTQLDELCIGRETDEKGLPVASQEKLFLLGADGKPLNNTALINPDMRMATFAGTSPRMLTSEETLGALRSDKIRRSITQQGRAGGLSQGASEFFRLPAANHPALRLLMNRMCFSLGSKGLVLEITAKKIYDKDVVEAGPFALWYVWEIEIEKMFVGPIERKSGEKIFNAKMHSRANDFKINSFKVGYDINNNDIVDEYTLDGETKQEVEEVFPYFKNGRINPLYSVLSPNNSDCIDIDFQLPPNVAASLLADDRASDSRKGPEPREGAERAGELYGALSEMLAIQFCAGSCSGYLLAASNGG